MGLMPIFFIFLGVTYHDTFYFILFGVSLIFSILIAVPSVLANKQFYLRLPKFKSKTKRTSETLLDEMGSHYKAIKHIDFRDPKTILAFLVQSPFSLLFLGLLLLFTYLNLIINLTCYNFNFSYSVS